MGAATVEATMEETATLRRRWLRWGGGVETRINTPRVWKCRSQFQSNTPSNCPSSRFPSANFSGVVFSNFIRLWRSTFVGDVPFRVKFVFLIPRSFTSPSLLSLVVVDPSRSWRIASKSSNRLEVDDPSRSRWSISKSTNRLEIDGPFRSRPVFVATPSSIRFWRSSLDNCLFRSFFVDPSKLDYKYFVPKMLALLEIDGLS